MDIKYDIRDKYQIYQDLKKEDPNIVVVVYPYLHLDENNQSILP